LVQLVLIYFLDALLSRANLLRRQNQDVRGKADAIAGQKGGQQNFEKYIWHLKKMFTQMGMKKVNCFSFFP